MQVLWVAPLSLFLLSVIEEATRGHSDTPWTSCHQDTCAAQHHESLWQTQETGFLIAEEPTQVASWTKSSWLKFSTDKTKKNLTEQKTPWQSDKKSNISSFQGPIVRLVSNFVVSSHFQNPKGMGWWKMHSYTSNSSGNQDPDMKCNSKKYCLKFTQYALWLT